MTPESEPVGNTAFSQYLTYPHHNGFTPDGRLVVGRLSADATLLCRVDPDTGAEAEIGSFSRTGESEYLWFDVARETGRVVAATPEALWVFEGLAEGPGSGRRVIPLDGVPENGLLPAISADGDRVLLQHRDESGNGFLCVHVPSGRVERHLSVDWLANHFHFCPHDESWIGFSHEGQKDFIPDRVWGWHAVLAPEGTCLFDQTGTGLYIGHERWCFHRTSAIGVAYGDSPGTPRGVYEFYTDGTPPCLISEADRDWHVNISRDGRWAVVDTTGSVGLPGKGWENKDGISHIVLIELETGERTHLAESRIRAAHPFHPHPTFSPDGKWIYFNRPGEDECHRVMRVRNPKVRGGMRG